MKRIEYFTQDKSEWEDGAWQTEPDKIQYMDEEFGFPCLILRNQLGALCGYVGVPSTHKAFEQDYNDAGGVIDDVADQMYRGSKAGQSNQDILKGMSTSNQERVIEIGNVARKGARKDSWNSFWSGKEWARTPKSQADLDAMSKGKRNQRVQDMRQVVNKRR